MVCTLSLAFLELASPHDFPYDQGKGVDVNLLEGLQVVEVDPSVQRFGGHVAEGTHLAGEEDREGKEREVR